ncbi:chaplin [Streptomyces sp. NBC_00344]|uniref:chaplin n=1 Tax=Streptomyces sp. NBC_00344 TaxID=2975720 RepID=UPI002E240DC1
MRQVTKKGLITVAAASGVLAITGGYAHADSAADGSASNSPGVLSGNSVQVPVHIPVNACGNTVNVIGLLNPAIGNHCINTSSAHSGHHRGDSRDGGYGDDKGGYGGSRHHGGGATAEGDTVGSPGVLSGNGVQVPVDVPVNACGNSVSVIGLGNATGGNDCVNESTPPAVTPHHPRAPHHPAPHAPTTPVVTPNTPVAQAAPEPVNAEQLAETGAGGLGLVIPASAGLILGGAILYRRSRAAA